MNYTEASNEELASQARDGDESAVAELVERCWPVLRTELLRSAAPEAARERARTVVVQAARSCNGNGDHFLSRLSVEAERSGQEKTARKRQPRGVLMPCPAPISLGTPWEATWEARSYSDENRANFPMDVLVRYIGQYVAWSPDATQIVDSDEDGEVLTARLREKGIDPSLLTFEHIPRL